MDTKWKKSKIIISFTAFFLGMTLLLTNFFSMMQLLAEADFQAGTDYQETDEFAGFISGRLETLIGAAAGGQDWYGYSYETAYVTEGVYEQGFDFSDWWQSIFGGPETSTEALTELTIDTVAEDTVVENTTASELWDDREESAVEAQDSSSAVTEETDEGGSLTSYMEELSQDRNLLFAVLYQGKLLYTNIDGLNGQLDQEIGMPDFASYVPEEEYNFTLLYNENGDSRVEINKDGQLVDVYGDGIYRNDSRWYVPGYTNFQAKGEAKEAVVFMAAAKEPRLYVENYAQGTVQRGWELYSVQENLRNQRQSFERQAVLMGAALLLLMLAFWFRKDLGEARRWIGDQLGKVWHEAKFLVFWCLPFLILGFGVLLGSLPSMLLGGSTLALWFWLFYFGILDRRCNKGRQKSLLRPFRDSLRTVDLKLPVQTRIVRRQWLAFAPCLLLLAVLTGFFLILWDCLYWNAVLLLFFILFACVAAALSCSVVYLKKNHRMAEDIGTLADRIAAVRAGELSERLEFPKDADLREAAENLNEIQQGMETALAERTKSERMKVELVANVSHDLKTPLTSIVSYIELLKQEEDLPEHVKDYIRILGEKSERLGTMVQDVFEISKAASGQLPVNLEKLDFGKLLRQTLADMSTQIEKSGLVLRTAVPDKPVMIMADGQRLYRVFQNLLQNALQYSLQGSRVYLSLSVKDGEAQAVMQNTSAAELDKSMDFTERFVRGDESRTDGGSGLGLSIARSFTEACGGQLRIQVEADLFTVIVTFPAEPA